MLFLICDFLWFWMFFWSFSIVIYLKMMCSILFRCYLLSFFYIKFNHQIINAMSRNATASWSGYAHQGKIGLLVAIRKLISLHGSDSDLSTFQIKYETQEDVSLIENGIPIQ